MADFARYLNIRSAHSPTLAADGSRVAFLTDITGNYQVWSVGCTGEGAATWPCQLTFFADKVWELYGTPTSEQLIAVGDVAGNERQQFYLITNYGRTATGAAAHEVRRLTSNDAAIHRFGAWSQDGRHLLYTSNARNNVDFDLYRLDLNSGASELVATTRGNRALVAWSPDGTQALMVDEEAAEQVEIYLIDLASGQERHLTAGQPPARYEAITWTAQGIYCLSDRAVDNFAFCRLGLADAALEPIVATPTLLADYPGQQGELEGVVVTADGLTAALLCNVEGYSYLYLVDIATGRRNPITTLPVGLITQLSFSADGTNLVFALQTPTRNQDIWLVACANGLARQLTFSNNAGIDAQRFVAPTLVHFSSFDGLSIPAFYYRPVAAPPEGGFPCILYVHGGPAMQQRPDFDLRFQYFLEEGYALLVTNARGSTGYGRHYMMLDDLEKRMDSVADLRFAVEWLQRQAEINPRKIAIYGRSYGGFMVLAALTEYPTLFAAAVEIVGIANWVSFMERTGPWRRNHRGREYGSLEHHRDLLERISPIHNAERIQTPLMVQAGDNDPRVPLFESEQIVARVHATGSIVEFIHYADEGHMFSKLNNRIDSFTRMAEFLRAYL